MINKSTFLLIAFLLPAVSNAAPVNIGNLSFDETAFADEVGSVSAPGPDNQFFTFTVEGGGFVLNDPSFFEEALTDKDINTGVDCEPAQPACTIDLLFTDNNVVNGPGNDLLLFEQGFPEPLNVIINGQTQNLLVANSSSSATENIFDANGDPLAMYFMNLDDFGVPLGEMINLVTLELIFTSPEEFFSADPMLLVALNSSAVPVPAAVWLFGTALIGLVGFSKRKEAA